MSKFEPLTKHILTLKGDVFGEWLVDNENDGTPEHPMHIPTFIYSKALNDFVKDLYEFCDSHPEFEHTRYRTIIEENGVKFNGKSMSNADISKLNSKCVIAFLFCAVRVDRYCEGALLGFLENGDIIRWLERLEELDE